MPSDHFAGVTVVAEGPVGRLRLDRPDGRSVLDHPLLGGLVDAARWLDARPDVRVVVVESAGKVFCSGFNVMAPGPLPLAREFTGEQAGRWGLVTEAVPAARLDATVEELAEAVVRSPRLVVEQVLAEVDRLAEAVGATSDGAADIERMTAAAADEGCRAARDTYLERWRDRPRR